MSSHESHFKSISLKKDFLLSYKNEQKLKEKKFIEPLVLRRENIILICK